MLQDWLPYVQQFTYPNYEIYLVDNSHDADYHKTMWDHGIACGYCPPGNKRAPEYIADSQNMLRDHFLQGDYDHYFSVECDNFPPLNIIELMLSFKLDNLNVPYFLKQGEDTTLGVQRSIINYQGFCANKVMAPHDGIRAFDGRVKHYYAPSMGCSLFSSRLMQRVRFRIDNSNPFAFSDSFFHMDSNRVGIKPYVHMGIICEHRRWTWNHNADLFKPIAA